MKGVQSLPDSGVVGCDSSGASPMFLHHGRGALAPLRHRLPPPSVAPPHRLRQNTTMSKTMKVRLQRATAVCLLKIIAYFYWQYIS